MYTRRRLSKLFLDWPSVKESDSLDLVMERVDFVTAIAKLEGVDYDSAVVALDEAWNTLNGMGSLILVKASTDLARKVLETINGH